MLTKKVRADTLKPGQFHLDGTRAGERKVQRITAVRETKIAPRGGRVKNTPAIELELSNGLNKPTDTIHYSPGAMVRTRA